MSDRTLDEAYSMAQELEEKVDKAQDKAVGFHLTVKDGDLDDETVSYLSKNVESKVESAHNAYTELTESLSDIERIREEAVTPERLIEEAEDRYLEEELDQGEMSEVVEQFGISIEAIDKPPENPEETVRFIVKNLRGYEELHHSLERYDYDFDLPDIVFETDTGQIIEETSEETFDRYRPEDGKFFTEE